jgi:hypothetical protein
MTIATGKNITTILPQNLPKIYFLATFRLFLKALALFNQGFTHIQKYKRQ